jgi:lysophospholipase L1-like esterase
MNRLRAAAAVLALCFVAAWGAHAASRVTTQASGRLPAHMTAASPGTAAGVVGHGAGVRLPVAGRPPAPGVAGGGSSVYVPVAGSPPEPGVPWFLTIGDSITFGYTRNSELAGTNISWAPRLERQLASQGRPWRLYDTACPGESTLSYATRCPLRSQVPLLAERSQRDAALEAIAANGAGLRLVVVALGSNDLLLGLNADPETTRAALLRHLEAILTELRTAAPGVPIVLADAYNPFAIAAPHTDELLIPVDDALAALAARLGDGFADFHAAINHATDGASLCSLVDCANRDIHPTALGQERLAGAVMKAVPPPA